VYREGLAGHYLPHIKNFNGEACFNKTSWNLIFFACNFFGGCMRRPGRMLVIWMLSRCLSMHTQHAGADQAILQYQGPLHAP
jgi:hypothetical protein